MTAVANLARDLGLDCVVEGVETLAQLASLRTLSARSAQGFHFARPADATAIESLLTGSLPLAAAPAPADPGSREPGPLDPGAREPGPLDPAAALPLAGTHPLPALS